MTRPSTTSDPAPNRGRLRRAALLSTAVLGAGAAATLLAAPASASTASSCDRTPWEAKVQGAPAGFGAGSRSGDYLWHDTHGFHLRVTHGTNHDRRVYTGLIHSSAALRMERVRLEGSDRATLSRDRRTITFVFANYGYVDGVNFHTDCASALSVSRLNVGNRALPPTQVYLGARRAHPAHVPFTVHRVAPKA